MEGRTSAAAFMSILFGALAVLTLRHLWPGSSAILDRRFQRFTHGDWTRFIAELSAAISIMSLSTYYSTISIIGILLWEGALRRVPHDRQLPSKKSLLKGLQPPAERPQLGDICTMCRDDCKLPKAAPCCHVYCKLCLELLMTEDITFCPYCHPELFPLERLHRYSSVIQLIGMLGFLMSCSQHFLSLTNIPSTNWPWTGLLFVLFDIYAAICTLVHPMSQALYGDQWIFETRLETTQYLMNVDLIRVSLYFTAVICRVEWDLLNAVLAELRAYSGVL